MHDLSIMFVDQDVPRARLGLLLEHFSELSDDREPGRIMYPLEEVLLLVIQRPGLAAGHDLEESGRGMERRLQFVQAVRQARIIEIR